MDFANELFNGIVTCLFLDETADGVRVDSINRSMGVNVELFRGEFTSTCGVKPGDEAHKGSIDTPVGITIELFRGVFASSCTIDTGDELRLYLASSSLDVNIELVGGETGRLSLAGTGDGGIANGKHSLAMYPTFSSSLQNIFRIPCNSRTEACEYLGRPVELYGESDVSLMG